MWQTTDCHAELSFQTLAAAGTAPLALLYYDRELHWESWHCEVALSMARCDFVTLGSLVPPGTFSASRSNIAVDWSGLPCAMEPQRPACHSSSDSCANGTERGETPASDLWTHTHQSHSAAPLLLDWLAAVALCRQRCLKVFTFWTWVKVRMLM